MEPTKVTEQTRQLMALRLRLERAWSRKTTHPQFKWEWRKSQPSLGQCYVTAMIVQDRFGGELLVGMPWQIEEPGKYTGDFILHVWNLLPDGTEVDLTSDQYGGVVPKKLAGIIGKPTTMGAKRSNTRYKLLKRRLEALR